MYWWKEHALITTTGYMKTSSQTIELSVYITNFTLERPSHSQCYEVNTTEAVTLPLLRISRKKCLYYTVYTLNISIKVSEQ